MVQKSLNEYAGVECPTVLHERKSTPRKHHKKGDSEEQIQNCLNCTIPASKCKGKCYDKGR